LNFKEIKSRSHLIDTQQYSLTDLEDIYKQRLLPLLIKIYEMWLAHIRTCLNCRSQGSQCEFCQNDEVLYAYQISKTVVCKNCKSVAHKDCYYQPNCPNCIRLEAQRTLNSPQIIRKFVNL